jgi:hypothetical protein
VTLTVAELHAASICELARTFPEPSAKDRAERLGQNLPAIGGVREFHGERCGWCDYTVDDLRALRADNQPDPRDEARWWALPQKARRKALEAAMSRGAM